jgi:hypothetical protein
VLLFCFCIENDFENVDNIVIAHNTFLQKPSSPVSSKIERFESQIIHNCWIMSNKTKEPKQDSHNRIRSPMPERGEP